MIESDFPMREGQTRPYPSGSPKLGAAWADIWARLKRAAEPLEGKALADAVAPAYGLQAATLTGMLSRAAGAGMLTSEIRKVETGTRGPRNRAFYSLPGQ
jgi:hypothetical protein